MSDNTTAEFQEVVTALLNEDQLFSLRERRYNARNTFVRPVRFTLKRNPQEILSGFTRNLSDTGIGLIHRFPVEVDDKANVMINRFWDQPVVVRCQAAWCGECENGWYQSGWKILSVEPANA